MACSEFSKNGNEAPPHEGLVDIKILVVGEPGCGKTKFIETFHNRNKSSGISEGRNSSIYPCKYEMSKRTSNINIFEFNGCPGVDPFQALKEHKDANGFILMYAIDDPLSFEWVTNKWYLNLNRETDGMWTRNEPAILVGNKRDLRDDPLVIQRLARENQGPVTVEQGENLVEQKEKIRKYFDCSSTQNDNVNEAFEHILVWAYNDLVNKVLQPLDEPNPEPEDA